MIAWMIVIAVLLLGLFFSAFFSGAETGMYCVNRLRLHLAAQEKDARALRVSRLLTDEQGTLSTALIGTNVANFITTSAFGYLLAELIGFGEHNAEIYTVVLLTPVVFVFGEVVPKNLFQRHADTLMLAGSRLLRGADRLFRILGIVPGLKLLARAVHRLTGSARDNVLAPKARIAAMLQDALAGQRHGEDRSELITRVVRLSETPIHTVMVPRNRVRTIGADTTRRGLVKVTRRAGHARLPVHDERNRRRILGIARVDGLLRTDDWTVVADRMRPAMMLSPHETVAAAIIRLQREHRGMAIVADRSGQMLGIVVLKDLLSQVVGELPTTV